MSPLRFGLLPTQIPLQEQTAEDIFMRGFALCAVACFLACGGSGPGSTSGATGGVPSGGSPDGGSSDGGSGAPSQDGGTAQPPPPTAGGYAIQELPPVEGVPDLFPRSINTR